LTQPGWEETADYFCEKDDKYGTSQLMFPAALHLPTDGKVTALALTTFGELMEFLEIVPGILQMLQGTS
jgi:hypothetical protein